MYDLGLVECGHVAGQRKNGNNAIRHQTGALELSEKTTEFSLRMYGGCEKVIWIYICRVTYSFSV